jgi:hypothetical protein
LIQVINHCYTSSKDVDPAAATDLDCEPPRADAANEHDGGVGTLQKSLVNEQQVHRQPSELEGEYFGALRPG